MEQVEIIARSQEQALERAAARLEMEVEDLHVIEEYEPDDQDLKDLEEVEKDLSDEQKTGEPILFVVQQSPAKAVGVVREWVTGLIERFRDGAEIEVMMEGNRIVVTIDSDDASIFIGKQGQTLAALQHIVTRVIPQKVENAPQVVLEVGDYRERREEQLERLADRAVEKARRTRRSVPLPPMPSQDRKYIHNYLMGTPGIETMSFGRDPRRHLEIQPEGARGGGKRRGGGGGGAKRGGGKKGPRKEDLELKQLDDIKSKLQQKTGDFEDDGFEDVGIEESGSRLPEYNEEKIDDSLLDPERPMVDPLE